MRNTLPQVRSLPIRDWNVENKMTEDEDLDECVAYL